MQMVGIMFCFHGAGRPSDFVISLLVVQDVGILGDQSLTRRCSEEGKLILYNLREKEEEEEETS